MKLLKDILNLLLFPLLFLAMFSMHSLHAEETVQVSNITVTPSSISITEADTSVTFTLKTDTCPTKGSISVAYTTQNGSAHANGDYQSKSGTKTFSQNSCNKTQTITINIKDDTNVESNENFKLKLTLSSSNPNQQWTFGGSTNDVIYKTITIKDNDTNTPPDPAGSKVKITKTSNKYYYDLDETITYTITATNLGPDKSKLTVRDWLPNGFNFISATENKGSFSCGYSSNVVTCNGGHQFNKDESVVVTVKAKSNTAGWYNNHARVNSATNQKDAWKGIEVVPGGQFGDVLIEKTVNNDTPNLYDEVTFRIKVTNVGALKKLRFYDRLPKANGDANWGTTRDAFQYVSYNIVSSDHPIKCYPNTNGNNPKLECRSKRVNTWNGEFFADGESFTVDLTVKVIHTGQICNLAKSYHMYKQGNNWKWQFHHSAQQCLDVTQGYPPTLANLPDREVTVGEWFRYRFNGYAHDPDGDPLTYTVNSSPALPNGVQARNHNKQIQGTPTVDGDYTVTVSVTDIAHNSQPATTVSKSFLLKVRYPALIARNDNYHMESNTTLTGNVLNNDEGYGKHITAYNDSTIVGGTLNFNQATGIFTFTPNPAFLGQTSFTYDLKDTNPNGATETATVSINVGSNFEDGYQPFELINPPLTRNILGNYIMTGNTVECITDSETSWGGTCTDTANLTSNNRATKYIDIDTDDTTYNSSSSTITLPNSFDKDEKGILWAGLFWQGRFSTYAYWDAAGDNRLFRYGNAPDDAAPLNITSETEETLKDLQANYIKFKVDTGSYEDIQALTIYGHTNQNGDQGQDNGKLGVSYAAYADVTGLVRNAIQTTGNHTFTVANLPTGEGYEKNPGLYGGWSLVVIYAEDFKGKVRNVSIYSGYDFIDKPAAGSPEGIDSTEIEISGFKLPAVGAINSALGIFSGEGEYTYGKNVDEYDRILISNDGTNYKYLDNSNYTSGSSSTEDKDNIFDAQFSGNIQRADISGKFNNLTFNNTGLDIDTFNTSAPMEAYRDLDANISSVKIKWETNLDTVTPSMLAFAAELYVPKLCYDYSYKQNGITFSEDNNGTEKAYITGNRLSPSDPITVELYLRNEEASDATLKNVKFDIYDINTSQAIYHRQSTAVTYPGSFIPTPIDDVDMNVSSAYIKNIPLEEIGAKDALYIDYDLDLVDNHTYINIPLDGRVNFTLDLLGGISYDLSVYLESMNVCGTDRYAYYPQYDVFNVEDKALSSDTLTDRYYDLPTQIVKRVGDYSITAYTETDFDLPKHVTTMVAVELIDVGKYHDINASCFEPDNTLSARVWIPFDNNQSKVDFTAAAIQYAIDHGKTSSNLINGGLTLDEPSAFYDKARENVAFRISYLREGEEGDVLDLVKRDCPGNKSEPCYRVNNFPSLSGVDLGNGPGNCIQDMANGRDKIPEYCGSTALIDGEHLAECLECIYGSNIRYVCSRDNFALRPKSFRVTLSDQNQTDDTQPKTEITTNNNTTVWNLVTGYNYHIDINATNFKDDSATPGYFGYFDESGEDGNRSFGFAWEDVSGHTDCLDKEDSNSSAHFYNGLTAIDVSHSQVGQYHLAMIDKTYSKVDWDPKYMGHQLKPHFLHGTDCTVGSSLSLTEGTATGTSGPDLDNVNGCEIASDLSGNALYTDLTTQFHPYTFDTAGLTPSAGPTDKSFIYIDSPSILLSENTDMSYNVNGTYFAADYTNSRLENFTDGCWGEDTFMQLNFTYNHTQPDNTPFLSYSLQDVNTSDTTIIYKPVNGELEIGDHDSISTPFEIDQEKIFYKKEMGGAITMDLGYNFNRQNDLTLNPRFITFNDFKIRYKTNPATVYAEGNSNYVIEGIKTLNKNVTFLYGRGKPSQTLYDDVVGNSIQTPISVVAYCDLGYAACQNRGFPLLDAQTGLADWWLNLDHSTADDDGDIVLKISSGAATVAPTTIGIVSGATDTSVTVSKTGTPPLPMTTVIDLDNGTDKWLIYNPLSPTASPSPFYRVRFIGVSDWAGHGDTGHVVGGTLNKKKPQRLGW